jgi:hypothetical protein
VDANLLVKVLAAVGGAALGALLIGWLVQLIAKLAFAQKVRGWPLAIVRTVGGVACGLLVWSLLGPSLGPGKGPGQGAGKGPGEGNRTEQPSDNGTSRGSDTNTSANTQTKGQTLVVEVLGDDPLREIARKQGVVFDSLRERRYRIVEGGKKVLKTRQEVEKIIKERRQSESDPLVALTIKVYKDSPARDTWVVPLEQSAAKLGTREKPLKVTQEIEASDAPLD